MPGSSAATAPRGMPTAIAVARISRVGKIRFAVLKATLQRNRGADARSDPSRRSARGMWVALQTLARHPMSALGTQHSAASSAAANPAISRLCSTERRTWPGLCRRWTTLPGAGGLPVIRRHPGTPMASSFPPMGRGFHHLKLCRQGIRTRRSESPDQCTCLQR